MFLLLLNVLSETSYFEGPGSKHIMFTMGDDFTYQVVFKTSKTGSCTYSHLVTNVVFPNFLTPNRGYPLLHGIENIAPDEG